MSMNNPTPEGDDRYLPDSALNPAQLFARRFAEQFLITNDQAQEAGREVLSRRRLLRRWVRMGEATVGIVAAAWVADRYQLLQGARNLAGSLWNNLREAVNASSAYQPVETLRQDIEILTPEQFFEKVFQNGQEDYSEANGFKAGIGFVVQDLPISYLQEADITTFVASEGISLWAGFGAPNRSVYQAAYGALFPQIKIDDYGEIAKCLHNDTSNSTPVLGVHTLNLLLFPDSGPAITPDMNPANPNGYPYKRLTVGGIVDPKKIQEVLAGR